MAVTTLVTTVGAANANAYVELTVADQYHEDRAPLDANWTAASDNLKNAAILKATELLDALFEWTGWVVDGTQALLWPRAGMVLLSGYSVPLDTIPTELQRATAEFAGQLLASDRAADSDIETLGIKRIKAGSLALEFNAEVLAKAVPDAIVYLLPREWYSSIKGRGSGVRSLVRC